MCSHDPTMESTIIIEKMTVAGDSKFVARCTSCGHETEPQKTRYDAQVESWCECWREEYC